jgi:predicted metalloprotease
LSTLLALGALSALVAACGSDGGGSTSADKAAANAQRPAEHVSLETAPYQAAKAENAVLYQAVQEDPETVGAFRDLMSAAANEIGGFWIRRVPELYGRQYTPPRFVGGYDPANGANVTCGGKPNALPGNAFFCPPDNYIAWDEPSFMIPLFRQSPLAPVFVLAHEWGHSVQHQLGVRFKHTIDAELDADCLAGAWAVDAASRGKLTREDFDRAVEILQAVQDKDGIPWTDSQAHGTAFERIDAFGHGVDRGPYACIRRGSAG